MKKIYQAVQTGKNKWEKRTKWLWSTEDKVGLIIFIIAFCYVALHFIG